MDKQQLLKQNRDLFRENAQLKQRLFQAEYGMIPPAEEDMGKIPIPLAWKGEARTSDQMEEFTRFMLKFKELGDATTT